ncbi:MAG: hypothetical protein IKJ15_00910 [Lachnospiraceae bacterium]|nr:hypothetical protein [Lachnospiraceae bacterium]
MSQITYLAGEQDGERILEILESAPANGSIELLYTRRPNAYISYKKESAETYVYAVKDEKQMLGTVTEIVRKVYISGEVKKLGYICGLKTDIQYKGNVNWVKTFIQNLVKEDIDSYFCSIISDNAYARKLFEKKRRRTMNMNHLQGYTTYMLAPYFKFKTDDRDYNFRQASKTDERVILEFLNSEGKRKDFFPVMESLNQFTDLNTKDFYILEYNSEIVAVGALWKQTGYRQYLVKKYHGLYKVARYLNPLLKLLGYIQLPKEEEVLDFPMLSFFISKDKDPEYYKVFLNHINSVIKKSYGMYVVGAMASSFEHEIYSKLKNIHFDTQIYEIEFILAKGKKLNIQPDNLWLECGLL